MWTQGALPAFLLQGQLDLVLTSMVLLREDMRLMSGEGAGRHRGRGRAGGGGSSPSGPTAWVEALQTTPLHIRGPLSPRNPLSSTLRDGARGIQS